MSISLTRLTPAHDIIKTSEYLASGTTQAQLFEAVRLGHIMRVRKGWYSTPTLHPDIAQAARVGGRLTGVSLAKLIEIPQPTGTTQRLWVPPSQTLHVAVAANGGRLRTRDDHHKRLAANPDQKVCVHWTAGPHGSDRCIVDLIEMLRDIIFCEHPLGAIATIDSALNSKLLSPRQFELLRALAPASAGKLLARVDGRSESGLESIARVRGAQFGERIRPQVSIGPHRVDLLIGERLVIELAGFEHHSSRADFDRDLKRAAEISALGYRVLTFGYHQILYRWAEVEASIRAAIARGDHL